MIDSLIFFEMNFESGGYIQRFHAATVLHKAEDYNRKYNVPYNITQNKIKWNQLLDVNERVIDMYHMIQSNVNDSDGIGLKLKETKFSYLDAKRFYNFLAAAYNRSEYDFYKDFESLPDRHREYKVLIQRTKRCKMPVFKSEAYINDVLDAAGMFRVPHHIHRLGKDYIAMQQCAKHYYTYFKAFNFDSTLEIGVHLVALAPNYDTSIVTLIKEYSVATCEDVDFRCSVRTANGGYANLFGVGSFVTHGCGRHTNVSFPNFQVGRYNAVKRKFQADPKPYPQILRAFYSRRFFRGAGVNPQCERSDCFK